MSIIPPWIFELAHNMQLLLAIAYNMALLSCPSRGSTDTSLRKWSQAFKWYFCVTVQLVIRLLIWQMAACTHTSQMLSRTFLAVMSSCRVSSAIVPSGRRAVITFRKALGHRGTSAGSSRVSFFPDVSYKAREDLCTSNVQCVINSILCDQAVQISVWRWVRVWLITLVTGQWDTVQISPWI